jgi:hypothetical protein
MNIYEHVIRFAKSDGNDKSYFAPKEKLDALEAQKGDLWRWLAPKSITQGIDERNLAVVLVKSAYSPQCGDPVQVNAVRYKIGRIRPQESEKYVEFAIWVGALPSAGNWKQFALTRANGQKVIGTFKGQQDNKAAYMQALKEFYESFPYTKVLCDVDGSKMRVRIWEKDGVLKLADEGLTVGLGLSTETNLNSPSITRIPQATHVYPARDSYHLTVGPSVQEGNIYKLGTRTLIAVAGDTAESIKQKLLGDEERYIVAKNAGVNVSTEVGIRSISNTNRLAIEAVFVETDDEDDNFYIRVSGSLQPGNIVQVSATGKVTKSYTVQQGDSTETIENYFNSDTGGFYTVASGVIPTASYLPGSQRIQNSNSPNLTLTNLEPIASYTVKRWQIIIGPDVKAGNVFNVLDQVYVAQDGDNDLTVAAALGYDSISFTVETAPTETPTAFATKGYLHNENNIADVTITEGPKLARSSQIIVDVEFTCDIEPGTYQLGIVDERSEEPALIALGNFIRLKSEAIGEIIEVADYGDAFGFEYYENGLTQRLRLPVYVNSPKQQTEEERVVKFMGGYRRTTTKIEYVSRLVTTAAHLPLHVTLATFLKHDHLRVGEKAYYNAGEYSENMLISGSDLRQASCDITELSKEKNNFSRYRSNYYQSGIYGGFCKVIGEGLRGRLQLWLRSSEIVREIEEWQLLNTASYQLIAETFDYVNLTIYHAGSHYLTAFLPKGQRIRLSNYLKLQTGESWIIQVGLSSACSTAPEITYKCESSQQHTLIYDCEAIEKPAFGEFSDDFSSDTTI